MGSESGVASRDAVARVALQAGPAVQRCRARLPMPVDAAAGQAGAGCRGGRQCDRAVGDVIPGMLGGVSVRERFDGPLKPDLLSKISC